MRYFLGIDPGKTGAWALIAEDGYLFDSGLNGESWNMLHILDSPPVSNQQVTACIEKAHAMPGQGTVSMFTFGEQFGIMQGMLKALEIPYELVSSNRWQKIIMDVLPAKLTVKIDEFPSERAKRRAANRAALKQSTVDFVIRRYPQLEKRLSLKKNQGIADAVCIALYALKRFKE